MSYGRNPMFADLPLGTTITEEMRLERMQDPKYFPDRKFYCLACHERLDYCGQSPTDHDLFLFYCKTCHANIEYRKLVD